MPVPEFDLDLLLSKVQKVAKKNKAKPDPNITLLCEVIASLVIEVAKLRGETLPTES